MHVLLTRKPVKKSLQTHHNTGECHNWTSGGVLLCHSAHGCLFLSHKRCVFVYFFLSHNVVWSSIFVALHGLFSLDQSKCGKDS